MFGFLSEKFSSIFSSLTGKGKLSESVVEQTLTQVEEALLESDVSYSIVQELMSQIKADVTGTRLQSSLKPGEYLVKVVYDRMLGFMGGESAIVSATFAIPSAVMVMGLQGSGKTTTCGKIAHFVQKQAQARGKKRDVLVASVDFYRPAAIDQLEIIARQVGCSFYRSSATNAVAAAKDIIAQFKRGGHELLILDTAGRLQVDQSMLEELKNIQAVVQPKHTILVLDAMTGQESLEVAKAFDVQVGFNSAVLTKMDSETRAGAAIAFRYALKKGIMFVGTGEKIDELEQFKPDRATKRMLGMGDLETLLERAEDKISQFETERASKALMSGSYTLEDFAQQMSMVGKLGSLSSMMQYLPGMGSMKVTPDMLEKGEQEMRRCRAIMGSMTHKERSNHLILDDSRKKRIAGGAGVSVEDVNLLLKRFEETRQFVKLFKKSGRFKGMLG